MADMQFDLIVPGHFNSLPKNFRRALLQSDGCDDRLINLKHAYPPQASSLMARYDSHLPTYLTMIRIGLAAKSNLSSRKMIDR
jgi:hypothetical protein